MKIFLLIDLEDEGYYKCDCGSDERKDPHPCRDGKLTVRQGDRRVYDLKWEESEGVTEKIIVLF